MTGIEFSKWVDKSLEERNKLRAKELNTEAVLLPKFAKALRQSTDVSGKFVDLHVFFLYIDNADGT